MQAVILVGGEGTRLRPLTSTVPKPVVPLVDRPFIAYMLEWLRRHGVDDVVMSCGFLATRVRNVLGDGSQYGLRLRFVEEPEPRGTAGALKYAEELLDERFLMLNGDVLTDIDLTAQIAQHERDRRARHARPRAGRGPDAPTASCGCTRTARSRGSSRSRSADQIDTNLICAGAYVLERARARPHPGRPRRLDRARGLAAARRRRALRLRRRRLLARHRDARALPAGDLRHPRGQRRAPPWPSAWATATSPSPSACRSTGASCRRRSSSAAARSRRARTSARSSSSARA